MSDEQNPYRFSGGASEEIVCASTIPRRLTLRDLKGISRGRRLLEGFLVLFVGSCLLTLSAIAIPPAEGVHGPAYVLDYEVALGGSVATLIGMVGLFLVGAKMIPLLGRRFAVAEALALLVPGPNAIVALLLIRDAKRTLEDRGVRVGWIVSDFSQARADRSYWRPRTL